MPLVAYQKAILAFSIAVARHLDPDCCNSDNPEEFKIRGAARGILKGAAEGAEYHIGHSYAQLAMHLREKADKLEVLVQDSASDDVVSAAKLLRAMAGGASNDDGDGPAYESEGGRKHCACGVLEFAALIETRVRAILRELADFPAGAGPLISYVTSLLDEGSEFASFRVDGETNIRNSPREVTILLRCRDLGARDLLHLAYTLHHELICHAFQGALGAGLLPNASQNCHWTEGWMDTLAFDLVKEWVAEASAPRDWLPMRGKNAVGALTRFHEHRYEEPKLTLGDRVRRLGARDAYGNLESALELVDSTKKHLARRFLLVANTHEQADCKRLKGLASNLRIALGTRARETAAYDAAMACWTFLQNRDLALLESVLARIAGN